MEKYGFVYIWFDKKRKMYYIGSHWGVEDDGYICSSNRMRKAYKRRPEDFKRRILSNNLSTRELQYKKEYEWLKLISEEELGKKYYNLYKRFKSHWVANTNQKIGKKISISKRKIFDEKRKNGLPCFEGQAAENLRIANERRRGFKMSDESKKKVSQGLINIWQNKEYQKKVSEGLKKSHANKSLKEKQQISDKISEALKASKELRSKKISALKWWNNGSINVRKTECPGREWGRGRV